MPASSKRRSPTEPSSGSVDFNSVTESFVSEAIPERKIKQIITEHYGVLVETDRDDNPVSHFYPYTDGRGHLVAYKQRVLPKQFYWVGPEKQIKQLFGQSVATGGRMLVITEGELDCLAVAQAQYDKYKKFYPVVSISSATSGIKAVLENREWIRGYKSVVLCCDNDSAGQEALEKLCKIIGHDKVLIASYPEKDPCEVLLTRGSQALMEAIFDAKPYVPDGIVTGEKIWEQYKKLKNVPAIPYPACMEGVNKKLRGSRAGEIVLLVSGSGSGKSTLMKEIALELLSYEQDPLTVNRIGALFLEESVGDTAEKFIGMHLKKNLQRAKLKESEERQAFEELFGDERLMLLDHQGSVEDESVVDRIEYMALMGCTHIFLDHITIAVSDGMEGKTGNESVDHLMSALLKLVKKHNIWLCIVSHLRKVDNKSKSFEEGRMPSLDDIKGSGSIKQISFDVLAFARDMTHVEEAVRNTIKLRVLKARKTGDTGDCGHMKYNVKTTRLEAAEALEFDES
jgi:twinkle protein